LAVLDQNSKVKSEKIKELRAQIFYRLERYEESYNLYRDIVKNSSDEFEQERLTNLQASAVNVENSDIFDEDETYEMCYNQGCQLLTRGDWAEAEVTLKKAQSMCETQMKVHTGRGRNDQFILISDHILDHCSKIDLRSYRDHIAVQ
jgi:hypothetical protein